MINEYRQLLLGLLRPHCHRRVPSQHLRRVPPRARPLRRREDRAHRHAADRRSARGLGRGGPALVRDTLRFFELMQPDLPLHVGRGHRRRLSCALPYLSGADGQDRGRRRLRGSTRRDRLGGSRPDDDARIWRRRLAARSTITVDPAALERTFTIPERNRAMVREFREVLDRAIPARMASDGRRIGVRPSCSPSPSVTLRLWPGCSMRLSPTRSRARPTATPISSFRAWARRTRPMAHA